MINANEIRADIATEDWLEDPFKILSEVSTVCTSNLKAGRELVIRILERRDKLSEMYRPILNDLAIQVGLYPYISNDSDLEQLSLRNAIQHAAHRADGTMGSYVLHSAQTRILVKLLAGESIILSAPTSFGKSLLIDMVIAAKDFQNIVLIVPTLALVEETRRRMSRFVDKYAIITASKQKSQNNNIFILTQERFLAMESEIPDVDFFVIDEFYKLSISGEGDRATQLNQALLKLSNTKAQFYLLGPSIKSVPPSVIKKLNCSFLVEDFETVAIELRKLPKRPNKGESLARLIDGIDGQTMVYCKSPGSARKVLKDYLERRDIALATDPELVEAADWTAKNYHHEWLVSKGLRHGIGIHHGKLPRSLGRFMIRMFEEKKIDLLLCTSTLIEGVNTSAKNVVIYDGSLNKQPLDFFTYNNIRGRSGRMFQHFIGRVYVFTDPPQPDLPFVDIPSFNPSEKTPSSLLLQIPREDLSKDLKCKIDRFTNQDLLPIELLREYSTIEPEYLLNAADHISKLSLHQLSLLQWSRRPDYKNILATSEIIWDQLKGAASAKRSAVFSAKMMTYWIWDLYRKRNVSKFRSSMITDQISQGKKPDEAVENVLSFLRGWASFNYPKYMTVLDAVVNAVLQKRGVQSCNYLPFAAVIEKLFQPDSFSSLEEYGLPFEISQKLLEKRLFNSTDELDDVVKSLRKHRLTDYADGIYEKRVIEDFQEGIGGEFI
ncbi:DEAD/DEAH box helicase [Desulfoluna butyratoxydans]|uniref:Dead/deah box helicase domain n=1 Tax=Desulfoluna butyratoxydans TaxID=231438 RepID=A0A4V6ILB9_9BACT|nr:DEAD/DEAH box helicase [Desulfoluna butyratoxydans]VFQ44538.1 dead/deah box helicase domain [Desulfoluna butyratoxydans]